MDELSKLGNSDHFLRIIRVSLFMSLFLIFFRISLEVNAIAYYHFKYVIISMNEFSTPPIPGTLVSLDVIGFIFPSIISILFLVNLLRSKSILSNYRIRVLLFAVLMALLSYSTFVHELRAISSTTHSGGLNYWELGAILCYIGYLLWINSDLEGRYSSYILGFLSGFLSDLESIPHLTEVTVFGGWGVLDADFVFPFLILVSFVLAIKITT